MGSAHIALSHPHSEPRSKQQGGRFSHLTDHDGERKDADKVVDELEADLEDGGGIRQAADGDQRLHRKVVAADVAAEAQVSSVFTLGTASRGPTPSK